VDCLDDEEQRHGVTDEELAAAYEARSMSGGPSNDP
jgi:hypothetical protein